MAIQNGLGSPPGGIFSQLSINVPTVLKVGRGTFWNVNIIQFNQADGYILDAASLTGLNFSNCLVRVNPLLLTNAGTDIPGAGPFPFLNGLVFVPGGDGMVASISWS